MQKEDIENLKKLIGSENVLEDKAHLLAYSYDATRLRYEPEAVVFPKGEEDVVAVLRYCNEHKIPVTTRGAGSGFTGGSLPSSGGIVLAMQRHMNSIVEIDMQNMVARVQPGVINMDLQKAVEEVGLFYPPDPASQDYSTIGGNVSENAGGMRAAKYGITKDYVMALRAVLPNGDIIRAGKKTIKDVAGFNVAGVLTASEGSLAVITEITLKLIAKPKMKKTAMGSFPTVHSAMEAVYKTMAAGVTPVAMEFLDRLSINAVESKFEKGLPKDAGAILITDVDGNSKQELLEQLEVIKSSFEQNGCDSFEVAANEQQAEDIWFARRNVSPSLSVYGNKKLNEDITVPRSKLPQLLQAIDEVAKKYDLNIPCFGHTGDGNVHTNVMVKDGSDPQQLEKGHSAIKEIFQIAVDLEGTLSGEHGIGLAKAEFMPMAFSSAEIALFKRIKEAFDPNGILNPNKMGI